MRILQVLHQFLPRHVGGVEIYVKNLSRRLVELGHEVVLFTGDGNILWNPVNRVENLSGLKIIRTYNQVSDHRGRVSFFRAFRNSDISIIFDQVLRNFQPKIIHFHHTMYLSGELVFLAKRTGIPTVLTVHDFWFICHKLHLLNWLGNQCLGPGSGVRCSFCVSAENQGFPQWFKTMLYLFPMVYRTKYQLKVLRAASALITPAAFVKGVLESHKVDSEKIVHIPYGIPYPRSSTPPENHSDKIRFGYLGVIKKHKGVHLLIEAFNRLVQDDATLDIHGDTTVDGIYHQELIQKCRNDRVSFKGPFANQNIGDLLRGIDVLIVPSVWHETGPMVIMEALAHQTPVIASNLGGMAELIREGENGSLFEPGDVESLYKRIRSILENPSILTDLRPSLDENYIIHHNVNSLCNIYRELAFSINGQ